MARATRRDFLGSGAAAAALGMIPVGMLGSCGRSNGLPSIRLILDYSPPVYPQHLAYWLAKSMGWFEKEGLNVEIEAARSSSIVLQLVAAGRVDFANIASTSLISAVAEQNIGLKMLGMFTQQDIMAAAWFESSGIRGLKDIEGRTMGLVAGSAPATLWPAVARKVGIDLAKVKIINTDVQTCFSQWGAKVFDVMGNYSLGTTRGDQFAGKGQKVVAAAFSDVVPLYGHGLATTTSMLSRDPDTVRKFVRVVQKSWAYLAAAPSSAVLEAARAVNIYVDAAPPADRIAQNALEVIPSRMVPPDAGAAASPFMADERWRQTIAVMNEAYGFRKVPEPGALYTNEFLTSGPEGGAHE